jgi:EpsI family protein
MKFSLTVFTLAATLLTATLMDNRQPELLARPLASIDSNIDGWIGTDNPPLSDAVLNELLATNYLSRTYRQADKKVDLFVAYYAQQRGGESMHSPKHCLPGSGWEIWDYGTAPVSKDGRLVEINKYSIENNGSRMIVLYWYQSKRRIIASEWQGKFLLVRDALLAGRTGGSLVRLTVPDQPSAVADGLAFATAVIPRMQRCLGN